MPRREQNLKAMPGEIYAFLDLRRLPGKLDFERAGWILGLTGQEVGIVVGAELLKPLGKPNQNSPKYVSSVDVEACAQNKEWMSKAMTAIHNHWRKRNQGQKTKNEPGTSA